MIGQYRPAARVRPGWHIRLEDPPGSETFIWCEVTMCLSAKNVITGERLRKFITADSKSGACLSNAAVMCRNMAEVREAGRGGAS